MPHIPDLYIASHIADRRIVLVRDGWADYPILWTTDAGNTRIGFDRPEMFSDAWQDRAYDALNLARNLAAFS